MTSVRCGAVALRQCLAGGFLIGERVVRRLAAILAADVVGYLRPQAYDQNDATCPGEVINLGSDRMAGSAGAGTA